MGTINVSATASLSANGTTTTTGSINWTAPTLPSGATAWDSIVLTGSYSWGGKGSVTVTINGTSVNADTTFNLNLGANATPPVTATCQGGNKNATGNNFTWTGLQAVYTYFLNYNISCSQPEFGTISLSNSGSVKEGTTITVTCVPDAGYALETLYVNGVAISGTSFVVSGDSVVTAVFVKQYTGLYLRESNAYVPTVKVFLKSSGVWVAQENVESLFDANVKYIRKN